MVLFEFLEIEENILDIKNGSYINIDNDKIDSSKNYMFLKNSIVIGFYIAEFFEDNFFNKDMINLLKKGIQYKNNRGDISGKICKSKLYPCLHKYINDNTKYNKNNTRIVKSNTCNYAFSNNFKSKVINKDKKEYINKKDYINKTLTPLIKKINKVSKQYFELKEDNHIYGVYNELVCNLSNRAAVHIDSNNKPNTLSCLVSLSLDNKLDTSYLSLVDLDLALPMKSNKSLLVFPLCSYRHANNHIDEDLLKDRLSLVFYNK